MIMDTYVYSNKQARGERQRAFKTHTSWKTRVSHTHLLTFLRKTVQAVSGHYNLTSIVMEVDITAMPEI